MREKEPWMKRGAKVRIHTGFEGVITSIKSFKHDGVVYVDCISVRINGSRVGKYHPHDVQEYNNFKSHQT